jgi:ABC-type glycerol-3-phosphate transport system substrate-binding protein
MVQVRFDIMTGLERFVSIRPGSNHSLKRYITPFLCLTLGLVLFLGVAACSRKTTSTPDSGTITQSGRPEQTVATTLSGTQAVKKSTVTPLPAIPATPNPHTPSPLGVTAAELHGLTVTLWHPWTGAAGASFQAILDEFNRTNTWGITARATGYEGFGSLDDAVAPALASGTQPDVLVDYGYQARQWDASGMLADLTPYVNDTVWGMTSDDQADFISGFWAEDLATTGSKPKSRRLGIPYYRSAYVLFYNLSWARELGYNQAPTTPEDFRLQACAAADFYARQGDKSSLGKGGWLITPEPGVLAGWIYAFGGEVTNTGGTGYLFNSPETGQAFTYLKGLQASGCAWWDPSLDPQAEFTSRHALFIVGSLFDIPSQQTVFTQAGSTDQWMVIPFPSKTQPVVDAYGPSLLITNSTPARQLAAWLVIEWLVYPPNQSKFVSELEVYPTRQSTLYYLVTEVSPQWAQAVGLLADARSEPSLASWSLVRWALSDASSQLFSLKFTADQIPILLTNLDDIAGEIMSQIH